MLQIDERIQEAIERVDSYQLPPEHFLKAVSDEVQRIVGSDATFQEAVLAVQFHSILRF